MDYAVSDESPCISEASHDACDGLQNRVPRFNSGRGLQKTPVNSLAGAHVAPFPPEASVQKLGQPFVARPAAPRWCLSHRADPAAKTLADRHYNRQNAESPQFAPPGSCLVLVSDCARAFWITSWPKAEFVKHAWAGAWVCSAFRSEGAGVASDLIRQALAATLAHYGDPPALGMITFIDRDEVKPTIVRSRPVWGWTWIKAGFREVGETKGGLLAFQLLPKDMPEPIPAAPRSMHGAPLFDFVSRPPSSCVTCVPSRNKQRGLES